MRLRHSRPQSRFVFSLGHPQDAQASSKQASKPNVQALSLSTTHIPSLSVTLSVSAQGSLNTVNNNYQNLLFVDRASQHKKHIHTTREKKRNQPSIKSHNSTSQPRNLKKSEKLKNSKKLVAYLNPADERCCSKNSTLGKLHSAPTSSSEASARRKP